MNLAREAFRTAEFQSSPRISLYLKKKKEKNVMHKFIKSGIPLTASGLTVAGLHIY